VRHLEEDAEMSRFELGLQFLNPEKMTYWGERQDTGFWIENASIKSDETHAPFTPSRGLLSFRARACRSWPAERKLVTGKRAPWQHQSRTMARGGRKPEGPDIDFPRSSGD
jgi:hypothetical protein